MYIEKYIMLLLRHYQNTCSSSRNLIQIYTQFINYTLPNVLLFGQEVKYELQISTPPSAMKKLS